MQIACLLAIDLFSKSYEKANGEGEGMKEAEGFLRLAIALLNYALTWSPVCGAGFCCCQGRGGRNWGGGESVGEGGSEEAILVFYVGGVSGFSFPFFLTPFFSIMPNSSSG